MPSFQQVVPDLVSLPSWLTTRLPPFASTADTALHRRMVKDTGKLLSAFIWGSVATVAGSLLAFKLLPLRGLGADGWKVAAALTVRLVAGCSSCQLPSS